MSQPVSSLHLMRSQKQDYSTAHTHPLTAQRQMQTAAKPCVEECLSQSTTLRKTVKNLFTTPTSAKLVPLIIPRQLQLEYLIDEY